MDTIKYLLTENQLPDAWYNIQADLPQPLPPVIHPGTKQPITPSDLAPLFVEALIEQEVSQDRWLDIPEPVQSIYRQWRPTPLYRARRLEQVLDTPAKIYYKYEGVSPTGSHKPNTAIPQAYYNQQAGIKCLTTETGAGQWGSSLALAGAILGLKVLVYMVKVSYQQKPYRRALMESFGAKVVASPSDETDAGRNILAETPDSTGSLGIAISEAVEMAVQDPQTKYALGSVLNIDEALLFDAPLPKGEWILGSSSPLKPSTLRFLVQRWFFRGALLFVRPTIVVFLQSLFCLNTVLLSFLQRFYLPTGRILELMNRTPYL